MQESSQLVTLLMHKLPLYSSCSIYTALQVALPCRGRHFLETPMYVLAFGNCSFDGFSCCMFERMEGTRLHTTRSLSGRRTNIAVRPIQMHDVVLDHPRTQRVHNSRYMLC